MSLPSVLIKKSTGEIVKHANYPREDMGKIIGLDPDYQWLVKSTPFVDPSYDSRIFVLNRTETVTETPHAEYPYLNLYEITFDLEKRTNEAIEIQLDNIETVANQEVFEPQKQLETMIKVLNSLIRSQKKLVLTPEEEEEFASINVIASKFAKNKENKEIKKQQLIDGLEPNIDEGWEKKQ